MPTSYSWSLIPEPEPVAFPDTGPAQLGVPSSSGALKRQFERGIKFGNVPAGKADNVVHGGARVYHVNSVCCLLQSPSDKSDLSGVMRFRRTGVPAAVNGQETRNLNAFGQVIFG